MTRDRAPATPWPFLLALACLFVILVTSPRGWHHIARHEPLGDLEARSPNKPRTLMLAAIGMAGGAEQSGAAAEVLAVPVPLETPPVTPAPIATKLVKSPSYIEL